MPKLRKLAQVSEAFSPGSAVGSTSHFTQRPDAVFTCIDTFFQRGMHIGLCGERGVGKTSLANVLPEIVSNADLPGLHGVRIDCNTNDTYNSIWRKVFHLLGLDTEMFETTSAAVDPEFVRFALEGLTGRTLIVLDELDRVVDDEALTLMADTIKTMSDHATDATLMFVGVAESVEYLMGEHESISRNVKEVMVPRMRRDQLKNILDVGFARVDDLTISSVAEARIVTAAEGLPHFVHLLGLNAGHNAIKEDQDQVTGKDVDSAERESTRTHLMGSEYRRATTSHQPDHLFEQVVLACSYTPKDNVGYFRAGDVREPLSAIMSQSMTIQRFQRHLNELSGALRRTLEKVGQPRHFRYRFQNPLFQPFVKMAARAGGLITEDLHEELQERQQAMSAISLEELPNAL